MNTLRVLAALVLVGGAVPASAASVFSDGFEGEVSGTSTPYSAFTNFNVTRGSVDLLGIPNSFGLTCRTGNRCVDLNGSATAANAGTNGRITSKTTFSFVAGDQVLLSFYLSGNQRAASDPDGDPWTIRFEFTTPTSFSARSFNSGFGESQLGPLTGQSFLELGSTIFPAQPYELRSAGFTAASAGSFTFSIAANDTDDFGPLLDDINLDITAGQAPAVPEPSTWATMLLGLGLVGAGLRRRGTTLTRA